MRSNQNGFGIVLVLIVCSLVGAAALYLMDITKVSEQKITQDARVLSYQQVVKYVNNHIHAGNNCTASLGNTDISGAFNEEGMSIQLDLKISEPPYNRIMKKPTPVLPGQVPRDAWFLAGGTSVRDVLLYVNERVRTPVRLAQPGAESWEAAKGYILIVPGHPGVGVKLARGRIYRIPIFLYYSKSDKRLKSCFDPAGDAYFCTVMGGAYDSAPGTPSDRRCQPDRSCFSYKAGIVSSPGSCPDPYVAQKIGFMGSDLYLCDWCNPNGFVSEEKGKNYYEPYPLSPLEILQNIKPEDYSCCATP